MSDLTFSEQVRVVLNLGIDTPDDLVLAEIERVRGRSLATGIAKRRAEIDQRADLELRATLATVLYGKAQVSRHTKYGAHDSTPTEDAVACADAIIAEVRKRQQEGK